MTITDLITESSVMAGVTALGETLSGNALAYGLSKINQMVDMWAADRLAIFRVQRSANLAIVSGTQSYTIGAGATWNIARPSWIDGAGIIQTPSATTPTEIPMQILTNLEYQQETAKTVQSALPTKLWYDRTFGATGYGTVYLYPVPNSSTPRIVLYLPIAVTEFAIGDTISLPPGYRMALVSNLAVLLCLGLREAPPGVQEVAIRSFGQLKSVNLVAQADALQCDPAVLPQHAAHFNYYTGQGQSR